MQIGTRMEHTTDCRGGFRTETGNGEELQQWQIQEKEKGFLLDALVC